MATTGQDLRRFPSPYEIGPPQGCEGYGEMYPYYSLFSEERRDLDEERCWILNGMHFPEAMFPFDLLSADQCYVGLGGANTRLFVVPPALGIEHRVLNGYVYMSSNSVVEPEEVERRAQLFLPRAGHYFQHWDELYERWVQKVEQATHKTVRQKVKLKSGIDKDTARHIQKQIKELKLKVNASIQGDALRVTGSKRDDLQAVIAALKASPPAIPLQFTNYR